MSEQQQDPPKLFLCLELCPKPGTPIPPGETAHDLLTSEGINGDGWIREWKVYDTPEKAAQHQVGSMTLVVLPLQLEPSE